MVSERSAKGVGLHSIAVRDVKQSKFFNDFIFAYNFILSDLHYLGTGWQATRMCVVDRESSVSEYVT